ncbi:hypothetical protein M407DRAFT_23461 [Tulasnella calospora MUT 4182]|uniref:F-box domain-containing protein n=1 Tax=Tulasnella calospora MUT 4182 TaxID=1051891 RepID=A0A0C3QL49_9AGAM|nr:hypothetical protein M407DRAFT_23461 [Tulasnella calospora MUT 4182]
MSLEHAEVSLPPELLVLVVEKLAEDAPHGPRLLSQISFALKQLSLASRFLRDISQPHLFRSLQLGDTGPFFMERTDNKDPLRLAERLEDLFSLNPTVKTWVHHLYIRIPNRDEPPDSPVGKLAAIAERLFLQMERLTKLEIEHMVITPAMHQQIYSLRELQDFRCWNVCYRDDPALTPAAPLSLRIKYLTINEIHSSSSLTAEIISQLALSPQLRQLHISKTISPFIYRLVIPPTNAVFHNLVDFETTIRQPSDLEELWQFLSACPNLSRLSVSGRADVWSWSSGIIPAMPASLVPGLKHLRAPLAIASLFGPHRSLESITVPDGNRQSLTKELLQTLPRRLLRLDIRNLRWDLEQSLSYLAELFPRLEEFELLFGGAERDTPQTHMEPILMETIRRLSHLKKFLLHRLSQRAFAPGTIDPEAQEAEKEFLESLATDPDGTSLCEVSLGTGWTWRRANGGPWICQSS